MVIFPINQQVIYVLQEWTDERLRWKPDDYNLNEIVIEARMLWVPEFAVING